MGTARLSQPFVIAHRLTPPAANPQRDIHETRLLLEESAWLKLRFPNGLGHEQLNLMSCTGSDQALKKALCAYEIGRLDALGIKPENRASYPGVTEFEPEIWAECHTQLGAKHKTLRLLRLYGHAMQSSYVSQIFNESDANALRHNIECLGGDAEPLSPPPLFGPLNRQLVNTLAKP